MNHAMNKNLLLSALLAATLAGCGNPPAPPAYNPPPNDPPATTQAPAPAPAASDQASNTGDSAAAPASTTPALASAPSGEAIYNQGCVACHGTGVAGAPKLGDAADWGPRIAQGEALLLEHAIKGFTGAKGMMPPKGGFVQFSDAQIADAVRFMTSKAD